MQQNSLRCCLLYTSLFMMALATSFAIHFYVTIMAFFLCASFVVFGIHRLFKRGNLRSLIAAAVIGVIIPAVPMGVAYATGTPFQGSIDWALNVISGDDTKEGRTQQAQELLNQEETTQQSSEISDNNEINDVQSTQVSTENSNVQQPTTEPSMIPVSYTHLIKRRKWLDGRVVHGG